MLRTSMNVICEYLRILSDTINANSLGTLTAFFDLAGERSPLPFKTMLI